MSKGQKVVQKGVPKRKGHISLESGLRRRNPCGESYKMSRCLPGRGNKGVSQAWVSAWSRVVGRWSVVGIGVLKKLKVIQMPLPLQSPVWSLIQETLSTAFAL